MMQNIVTYIKNNGNRTINMVYNHDDESFRDQDEEKHGDITSDVMDIIWYLIHDGVRTGKPRKFIDCDCNGSVTILTNDRNMYIVTIKAF